MASLILIEQFKQHLVTNSVVRATANTPGALPPCWLNPQDGPRQPEGADTAAVTLRGSGQLPTDHLEGFLEDAVVEVIVRARQSPAGELLQRVIRGLVNDRHHFAMGSLTVQYCLLFRGVQPVPLLPGATSKTYDSTQSFLFEVRVADLTVA